VDEAVTRFLAASESKDIDGMVATLAPDVELVSPLSGRMVFRGTDDVHLLLDAVYRGLTGLRWDREMGDDRARVAVSRGKIGGVTIDDAMVFELDDDGRIARIRPHLRPWLALTVLALRLGPAIARRPGVVWRALHQQPRSS
jgi:ketosteroid isomerase-like protein